MSRGARASRPIASSSSTMPAFSALVVVAMASVPS